MRRNILFFVLSLFLISPAFSQYAALRFLIQPAKRSYTVIKGFKIPQSTLSITHKRLPSINKQIQGIGNYGDDINSIYRQRLPRTLSVLQKLELSQLPKIGNQLPKQVASSNNVRKFAQRSTEQLLARRAANRPSSVNYFKYVPERTTDLRKVLMGNKAAPPSQTLTFQNHQRVATELARLDHELTQYRQLTQLLGQELPPLKNPPAWYLDESDQGVKAFYRFAQHTQLEGDALKVALKQEVQKLEGIYTTYQDKIRVLQAGTSYGPMENLQVFSFQEQYQLPQTWILDQPTRTFINRKYTQLQIAAEQYLDLAFRLEKSRYKGASFQLEEPENLQRFFGIYLKESQHVDDVIRQITSEAQLFQKEIQYWDEQLRLLDYADVQQFQVQHSLSQSSIYDAQTQKLIRNQKSAAEKVLEAMGIRQDHAISFYKQHGQRPGTPLVSSIQMDYEAGYWFTSRGKKLQQKTFTHYG
ncbi:MAG: hypothetical protein AAFR59_11620 [Bacteroidota bacterium]